MLALSCALSWPARATVAAAIASNKGLAVCGKRDGTPQDTGTKCRADASAANDHCYSLFTTPPLPMLSHSPHAQLGIPKAPSAAVTRHRLGKKIGGA